MKKGSIVLVIATALMLSACVAPPPRLNTSDPQAVSSAISVQRDDFKKVTNYKGPNTSSDIFDQVFIRAWKSDATGTTDYQIYVADYYSGDWRFYNSAFDSNGNNLDVTVISRDVDSCSRYGCSHTEHIGLNITRGYLEKNQEVGIRFKLSGKAGEEIFYIPAGYIKAFLAATKIEKQAAMASPNIGKQTQDLVPGIKTEIASISSLPDNAGGVSLRAPSIAENGSVVPVEITLQSPLAPGDTMIISGDGERALEIKTNTHPVSMVSTRLRLSNGKVSAYAIRGNGQVDSGTQYIRIGIPAGNPPSSGNGGTEHKVRASGREVKMLFSNDMAMSGHIHNVVINPENGGPIYVTFTPRMSKNPYLGVESTNNIGSATVTVNTN